jgi:hypothetical protein
MRAVKAAANGRFGSQTDIGACPNNVRYTPESGLAGMSRFTR